MTPTPVQLYCKMNLGILMYSYYHEAVTLIELDRFINIYLHINLRCTVAPKGQTVLKYTKNMIFIKKENPLESIGTAFLNIH